MNKTQASNELGFLASPLTGGGVAVNRFQQFFLMARQQGRKTPREWAQFTWDQLQALGSRLTKKGQALATAVENLAELTRQAEDFTARRLPVLKALQIT